MTLALKLMILMQVLDLLTTLWFLKLGIKEANVLILRLGALMGSVRNAVIVLKLAVITLLQTLAVQGAFEGPYEAAAWALNVYYTGIIAWNLYVIHKRG